MNPAGYQEWYCEWPCHEPCYEVLEYFALSGLNIKQTLLYHLSQMDTLPSYEIRLLDFVDSKNLNRQSTNFLTRDLFFKVLKFQRKNGRHDTSQILFFLSKKKYILSCYITQIKIGTKTEHNLHF